MMRVAIVGLGAATGNIHLPAYRQLAAHMTVVGGCDIDHSRRERARRQWGLAQVYDNVQEMIEQSMPDVVSICTPPSLHLEQTAMALDRGCHVFCEKPFAEDLGQADQMINHAEKAGRFLAVNHQFPYMNIHSAAKSLIGSSEFGRLLFIQAWQTMQPLDGREEGWRGSLQRRICFEFGVHVFELIRFFFEENPVKVLAHMPNPQADRRSETIVTVSLEFSDGRAASVVLNRLSRGPVRYLDLRLDGESGSIHTSIGGKARFQLGIHTANRRPFARLDFAQGGRAMLQKGTRSRTIARDRINPFASATAAHFKNFLDSIERGVQPPGNARDARSTLGIALAAYESAETGRVVELERYFSIPTPVPEAASARQ